MNKLIKLTKLQMSKINAGMLVKGEMSYFVKFSKNYKEGKSQGILLKDPQRPTRAFVVDQESFELFKSNESNTTAEQFTELFGDFEKLPEKLCKEDELYKLANIEVE